MSIERELEHTEDGEAGELATLSEEQQNLVQIDKIADMTIEPGVMRLPVTQVTSTPGNDRWSIRVEHPVEGERFFNMDKPRTWHEDAELVELLRWYDIHDRDVYKLQTKHLYVEYNGDASESPHGWDLIEPPWMETRREARRRQQPWHKRTWGRARDGVTERMPHRTYTLVWTAMWMGAVTPFLVLALAGVISGMAAGAYAAAAVSGIIFATVTAIALTEPPEGGDRR